MYLNSGTSTLLVTQDSDKKLNQFRSLSSPLPIGQKVRVKVSEIDRMLKVYVNGAYYYSFTVDGNRPVGPTKIYMSNPWENPASATIGNVQINTCPTVSLAAPSSSCAPVTLLSDFKQIERDTYLGRVTLKEDYRLDFDINLKQIPTTWVNVLHFTKGDSDITTVGDRAPAVWIIPNKAKLFVSQDAGNQKNLGVESSLTIPIGTRVHVIIIAIGDTLKVYVGETLYESITIPNPYSVFTLPGLKPTGNVHVYASDPWYTAPNAELGAVVFNPCPTLPKLLEPSNSCSKVNVFEGTTFIEKNTLLGSVNVLGDYAIEFDLTINGIVPDWANILHLTQTGRNLGTVGDRIPGIWLFPGKAKIYVSQDTVTAINQGYAEPDVKSLDIGKKYRVKVLSSHRQLEVFVNNELYVRKFLTGATPTGPAQLFMSDNWHTPANAIISQVTYDPCPKVIPLLTPKNTCDIIPLEIPSSSLQQGYYLGQINVRSNYEIEFDMVINGVTNDWGSIMHFSMTGNNYGVVGDRVPGIWLYPKSTMIHVPQDAGTTINQHRNPTKELALNKLYRVKVRSFGSQQKIYIDNVWYYTHNLIGNKPSGAAHVFMADPWYSPANVQISNAIYTPCPDPDILFTATDKCDKITLIDSAALIEPSDYMGLVTVNADYEIEFNLTINALTPSWGNILHFTKSNNNILNNGDRIPGVWLYPNAATLLVAQDFDTQANVATPMGATISMGVPHYIKIVAVGQKIRTFVDNVLYSTLTNSNPRTKGVANVYIGDPWHTPADAWISKVYYNPCPTPFKYLEPSKTCDVVNVFSGSTAIEQNTLLGSVNVLGDYAIEFDLTINGIVDGWSNILHLTQTGRNLGTVGDRIPGIWLFPGKAKIYVSQDTVTAINQGYAEPDVKSLDIGKKYHVKVLSSHRQLEVYVDDILYARKFLTGATPTGPAQLFMSDNWHTPANAIISQVTYDPCPDVIPLLTPKNTCDTIPLEIPSSSLQQGYYLGQINVRSNYEIEFDMVINGVTNDWGSIMHFSLTGNNYGVVGDRVPGIWLYP
ncbi:hypothetical protein HDV02_004740, partial [Globomyces sp. JEL0801]